MDTCYIPHTPHPRWLSSPRFVITPSLLLSLPLPANRSYISQNMLVGLINSVPVSVAVQPATSTSTITLSAAFQHQLLPIFDRFGLYTCNISLSVPTNNGFYTSKLSLQCSHTPGESDIILGSDWMSTCSVVLCDGGFILADPSRPAITSLPAGHYWTRNEGEIVSSLYQMFY